MATQAGRSALIADDDQFFRAAAGAILTKELGFTAVVEAGSFDEAVERLQEDPEQAISLALFDLAMPGISNPANLRSIRDAVPDVLIVVVSASESRANIITSLEAGVHGYVPKRLGIEELARAVRRVLAGEVHVPAFLTDFRREGETTSAEAGVGGRDQNRAQVARVEDLTPRQQDVLKLIVHGKSNKEIARALELSEGTVRVHMSALFRNLGVENRTAAAAVGSSMLPEQADQTARLPRRR